MVHFVQSDVRSSPRKEIQTKHLPPLTTCLLETWSKLPVAKSKGRQLNRKRTPSRRYPTSIILTIDLTVRFTLTSRFVLQLATAGNLAFSMSSLSCTNMYSMHLGSFSFWFGCIASSNLAFSNLSRSSTFGNFATQSSQPIRSNPLLCTQLNVASADTISVANMERGVGGRIESAFEAAKEKGEAAFVTFITAGYPNAQGACSAKK